MNFKTDIFMKFDKEWALLTAGTLDDHNTDNPALVVLSARECSEGWLWQLLSRSLTYQMYI